MRLRKAKCDQLDLEEILSLYDVGHLVGYLDVSGVPNRTFKVCTTQRNLALRIYGQGQSSLDHIIMEHKVLTFLEKKMEKTPKLIRGVNGSTLQAWGDYHLCAFEWVEGETADSCHVDSPLVASVGSSVAELRLALAEFPIGLVPKAETVFERGQLAVNSISEALAEKGWKLEANVVETHWREARETVEGRCKGKYQLLHADTWPPNIVCRNGKVAGIIDFDDCCAGPEIIDIAIPLQEFAVFQHQTASRELAHGFFTGLSHCGYRIPVEDLPQVVPAMKLMCAMWCAYNVIQSPRVQDATLYYRRLGQLSSERFVRSIEKMIDSAPHVYKENDAP